MKKNYSLRAVSVILSILMIASVFTVIHVSAVSEIKKISLFYDEDTAYLNTELKEKEVNQKLADTFQTTTAGAGFVASKSFLCYINPATNNFEYLSESENYAKPSRKYYYRANFKLESGYNWSSEITSVSEGTAKRLSAFENFSVFVNSSDTALDNGFVAYFSDTQTIGVYIPFDNWGEKNSGKTGDCDWIVDGGTLKITGSGKTGDHRNDDAPWRDRTDRIRRIEIEADAGETITISNSTFSGLYNADSVTMSGVDKIGDRAFEHCVSLYRLIIPSTVTEIGEYAFANTGKLSSVNLLPTVESIGDHAFGYLLGDDKKENFKIYSENNDEAYRYAQANGFSWENIYALAGENASWSYNSTTKTLSVTGSGEMYDYNGSAAPWLGYADDAWTISIGEGITSIGMWDFMDMKAMNVELPSTLKIIDQEAFENSGITQLICPDNLEKIRGYVFQHCKSLSEVKLNNSLQYVGYMAFYDTGAQMVKVPATVTKVEDYALGFYENAYTGKKTLDPDFVLCGETGSSAETYANKFNITFYNATGTTGDLDWVYSEKDKRLIIIGSGETADYNSASEQPWYGLNIKTIEFKGDVTHIGDYAFAGLNLSSIEFPAALTSIGKHAFDSAFGNRLTDISIPISVGKVDKDAFKGNTFNSVAVMKKTCDIDESADTLGTASKIIGTTGSNAYNFAQQHSIQFVSASGGTVGNWSWDFDSETGLLTIAGEGDMTDYAVGENPPWYSFRNEIKAITIGSGITRIGNRAFVGCLRNENFLIEGKYNEETYSYEYALNSIGDSAFANNASLQMADETIIPPTLKEIGDNAFRGCSHMYKLYLPYGLETIGENAFAVMPMLESLTIPETVKSIGDKAFSYDYSFETSQLEKVDNLIVNVTYGSEGYQFCKDNDIDPVVEYSGKSGSCKWEFKPWDDNQLEFTHDPESHNASLEMADYSDAKRPTWYNFRDEVKSIILDSEMKYCGEYAFADMPNLESATIPREVKAHAFENCPKLTISAGYADNIGDYAFAGCTSIEELELSNAVNIGAHAFENCSALETAYFGGLLITVGEEAFMGTALSGVFVPEGETLWEKENREFGAKCFGYDKNGNKTEGFTITTNYDGDKICDYARDNGFELVFLGQDQSGKFDDVEWKYNGYYATLTFSGKGEIPSMSGKNAPWKSVANFIAEIVIEDGITAIGVDVFTDCKNASAKISRTVKKIDAHAFDGCYLGIVYVPSSVTEIGEKAIGYKNGTLDDDCVIVAAKDSEAQKYAEENSINYKPLSGKIGEDFTWDYDESTCTLTISGKGDLNGDDLETAFNDDMYVIDSLVKKLVIGDEITSIPENAFAGRFSNLDYVKLGSGVKTIGKWAFMRDDKDAPLKYMYIPSTVETIGERAIGTYISVPPQYIYDFEVLTPAGSAASTYGGVYMKTTETEKDPGDRNPDSGKVEGETKPTAKVGDVNGDGEIKNDDAMLLKRYVAGWENITIVKANADINGDGEIKNDDAMILKRYVAGWDDESITQYFTPAT